MSLACVASDRSHAAARTALRLVRRRRDDRRVRIRMRMGAGHDQARNVRDDGDEHGADGHRDRREARVVPRARIRRATAIDQLRLRLTRQRFDAVQVDAMRLGIDLVLQRTCRRCPRNSRPAVRQMAAERQTETHDGIAGLRQREITALVGR